MNERLRCENSNEATSSFPILLFITSVVQSVTLILLICGLNDCFSVVLFVSQWYLAESKRLPGLQTIRCKKSKSGAKDKSPFISQVYELVIIFLSYLTERTSPFIGQNSISRHHQSVRMEPSASRP